MPEERAGRRAYDRDLDPIVETYVEKRLTDTRHELRNEWRAAIISLEAKLTEVQAEIAKSALQSTKEHMENRAHLEQVGEKVAELQPLIARVATLERHDDIDEAREETRTELSTIARSTRRWTIGTAVALVGIAVPALIALVSHA